MNTPTATGRSLLITGFVAVLILTGCGSTPTETSTGPAAPPAPTQTDIKKREHEGHRRHDVKVPSPFAGGNRREHLAHADR